MQKFNLSKRMAAVARLVPCGVSACDIGCDHGFVAIYLVREHICPRVIAMDINRGPLSRAREHIESAGLSSYIETRLSDGMEKLNIGEAECIIAAGMGGRLTVKILNDFPEKRKSLRYLVLQPQSELAFVRRYLRSEGLVIRKEDMVLEDGKFYPMMLAEVGETGKEDGISGREREPGREDEICGREREPGREDGISGRESAPGKKDGICGSAKEPVSPGERQRDLGGKATYQESLTDEFGPCLIRDRHPVLAEYLDFWEGQQYKILKEVSAYPERREQVEEELRRIRDVRGMMKGQ